MDKKIYDNYVKILHKELIPAMGCTEPIALAYAAATLSCLLQHSEKPIVLTGAQLPMGVPGSDAAENLKDAFAWALSEGARGVRIVFAGRVIRGLRARKRHTTDPDAFNDVVKGLEEKGYTFASAEIEMVPQNYITLSDEGDMKNMSKLIDMLEDNDDVQNVWHNWENAD